VRALGADLAVDYARPDWTDHVRAAAPGGVDIVLDAVGGSILHSSIDLLAPFGRTVVYGAASGDLESVPVGKLFALRTVTGFSITAWRAADADAARQDLDETAGMFAAGDLRATVHASLPLAQARTAHELIERRAHPGSILLVMDRR
jgi:NADPH:quinone reductase-like Zn-dependent oxidoreductase